MPLPQNIKQKFLDRFDELIAEGEAILADIKVIPGNHYETWPGQYKKHPDRYKFDWQRFVKWRTNAKNLLVQIISPDTPQREAVEVFDLLKNKKDNLEYGISFLKATAEDFQFGFLDDLSERIESEISANYMSQAEQLLNEGQNGKWDHVPAAVLAGAVFEKALRTLCEKQESPISPTKDSGEPKKVAVLIDELKKIGLYNENKAKQLRSWAGTRNHAAHGEFGQFNRQDVEQMINGINNFLAEYLG